MMEAAESFRVPGAVRQLMKKRCVVGFRTYEACGVGHLDDIAYWTIASVITAVLNYWGVGHALDDELCAS